MKTSIRKIVASNLTVMLALIFITAGSSYYILHESAAKANEHLAAGMPIEDIVALQQSYNAMAGYWEDYIFMGDPEYKNLYRDERGRFFARLANLSSSSEQKKRYTVAKAARDLENLAREWDEIVALPMIERRESAKKFIPERYMGNGYGKEYSDAINKKFLNLGREEDSYFLGLRAMVYQYWYMAFIPAVIFALSLFALPALIWGVRDKSILFPEDVDSFLAWELSFQRTRESAAWSSEDFEASRKALPNTMEAIRAIRNSVSKFRASETNPESPGTSIVESLRDAKARTEIEISEYSRVIEEWSAGRLSALPESPRDTGRLSKALGALHEYLLKVKRALATISEPDERRLITDFEESDELGNALRMIISHARIQDSGWQERAGMFKALIAETRATLDSLHDRVDRWRRRLKAGDALRDSMSGFGDDIDGSRRDFEEKRTALDGVVQKWDGGIREVAGDVADASEKTRHIEERLRRLDALFRSAALDADRAVKAADTLRLVAVNLSLESSRIGERGKTIAAVSSRIENINDDMTVLLAGVCSSFRESAQSLSSIIDLAKTLDERESALSAKTETLGGIPKEFGAAALSLSEPAAALAAVLNRLRESAGGIPAIGESGAGTVNEADADLESIRKNTDRMLALMEA